MTANAGYHAYATGDVLTAAQVQYNLQNQTTMYFASASARTTALTGVVVEGMVSYIPANGIEYYNGSAWVSISQAVTALTTKGDLLTYSTQDTRLPVGSDGQTLVANSSQTTGLAYTNNFAAGKNKIINGDFGVWQRGTSFSNPTNGTYTADRWFVELDGTGYTRTISQQTFTPGTAPVAGYEGQYFYRWNNSVAGTGNTINALSTRLEDIRTFAGQTITFSFWAKADASRALTVYAYQQSTGGSGTVTTTVGSATLTTSWARYTMTVAIPSLSGITIGTNSNLQIRIAMPTGVTMTCDFWGMQMEANSVATAFQTATGTIQGELAACQRYYYRQTADGDLYQNFGFGMVTNTTTSARIQISNPVTMRAKPTSIDFATLRTADYGAGYAVSAITFGETGIYSNWLTVTMAAGTAYRPVALGANNSNTAYIGVSAEL